MLTKICAVDDCGKPYAAKGNVKTCSDACWQIQARKMMRAASARYEQSHAEKRKQQKRNAQERYRSRHPEKVKSSKRIKSGRGQAWRKNDLAPLRSHHRHWPDSVKITRKKQANAWKKANPASVKKNDLHYRLRNLDYIRVRKRKDAKHERSAAWKQMLRQLETVL